MVSFDSFFYPLSNDIKKNLLKVNFWLSFGQIECKTCRILCHLILLAIFVKNQYIRRIFISFNRAHSKLLNDTKNSSISFTMKKVTALQTFWKYAPKTKPGLKIKGIFDGFQNLMGGIPSISITARWTFLLCPQCGLLVGKSLCVCAKICRQLAAK